MARLPLAIRTEINIRLREGWRLQTLADWLFQQRVECDVPDLGLKVGDPCSLVWTRTAKNESMARLVCRNGLSRWLRDGYTDWVKEEAESDKRVRLVDRVEQLSQAASERGQAGATEGGNLIIRSLLMEAITEVCQGGSDPADIACLANAWARTNQAGTEFAKLKLRTQESTDAGLQALYEDVKDNPEALALFNKFRDLVKASTPQNS
jgi:hypothetical protein